MTDTAVSGRRDSGRRAPDRRAIGIAVLLAAVLAAAVLPTLGGRRIAGAATHADVPVVGDCLAGVVSRTTQDPVSVSDTGWSVYSPSRASRGRCADTGAGRILAVEYGVTIGGPVTLSSLQEREDRICDPAVRELRRTVAGPDTSWNAGDRKIGFRAVVRPYVELIGAPEDAPDQWVACVPFFDAAGGREAVSLTGHHPMDQLGDCRSTPLSVGIAPCADPHRAEVIGRAALAFGSPDRADYTTACREFFTATTGLADPAGAGLAVQVRDSTEWAQGPRECLAVATDPERTLSGSLVGLAGSPVPWTG